MTLPLLRAILSLLYSHGEAFYLRQIARTTGIGLGPIQRELKQLAGAGIIRRTVRGRQVYYQANPNSPVFQELKGLVAKSATASASGKKGVSIPIPSRKIAYFCRRHYIRRLSLFGSVLRDDFRPDSDIDVLIEFEPGKTPGFLRLADIETELSGLFGGRMVDLRTPQDLSRYFRDQVVAEARVQYTAAG
jgi:predicted nucleotidyltransferase